MRPGNSLRGAFLALINVLVAACGGGSGGNSGTAVPVAPTLTLAASSIVAGSSTTITWSSADATSCAASGTWSGTLAASGSQTITPTAAGTFIYELTCANSAGSSKPSTATLTALHAMYYGSSNYQFTTGIAAQTLTPNVSSLKDWSITPALPAGLVFNGGNISGTPTVAAPAAQYLVTGIDSAGTKYGAELTMGVTSNFLLNLGHAAPLVLLQFDTSHVLSEDQTGQWVLWNYATAAQIASGVALTLNQSSASDQPASMGLAGPTVVFQTNTGLEVRSSATGSVLAEITVQPAWWKLASDGSYVCAGNGSQLACWSPAGQLLFSEAGNYFTTNALAIPSGLLVAMGPAGNGVIETVSSSTWTSSVGAPFQGTFYAWFVDGSQFLTTDATSNTVYEYSLSSVIEGSAALSSLQGLFGQGNWIWTAQASVVINNVVQSNVVTVYEVGYSATPAATFTLSSEYVPIGTFIAAILGSSLTVVDLSGASPVETNYTLPIAAPLPGAFEPLAFLYVGISPSQFMESSGNGVLVDGSVPGAPRIFAYGSVIGIAGSTARAVFTTESGNTFSYSTTTDAFERTVNLNSNQPVALSADGSVLAALDTSGNINIYSLPGWTLINSFPSSNATAAPISVVLSASGTTLGEQLSNGSTQSMPTTGGSPTSYPGPGPILLSPNGTLAAVASESLSTLFQSPNQVYIAPSTAVYQNGALLTTLNGYPVGWLDNSRLLVNNYQDGCDGLMLAFICYEGTTLYGPTGIILAAPPIGMSGNNEGLGEDGEIVSLQVVSSDLVFGPPYTEVISITAGTGTWASADPCGGPPTYYTYTCFNAFAGSAVLFVSGNWVIAQPY
jgi:hypothetical protein